MKLIITTVFCVFVGVTRTDAAPKLEKIGVMLSLSGAYSVYGVGVWRGIEIAASEDAIKPEIVIEDIGSMDANNAARVAHKLIEIDKVQVVLTLVIDDAKPVISIFQSAQVPIVVLWDSNNLVRSGGPYLFSTGFSTEDGGRKVAVFLAKMQKAKRIALMTNPGYWSETIVGAFKQGLKEDGGEIVFEDTVPSEQVDFKSIIARIKALHVDAVYVPLNLPQSCAQFVKQAQQLNLRIPLITGEVFVGDAWNAAGPAAEGVYVCWIKSDSTEMLLSKYKNRYHQEPMQAAIISVGYDGYQRVRKAMNFSKEKGISIREGLLNELGPSKTADRPMTVTQVSGGTLVEVGLR